MKSYAGRQFETYEASGQELRVHWNIEQITKEGMDGQPETQWEANEALCGVADDRATLISKIIGSVYTLADEIATINNKDSKPDEYANYQAFRTQAKALADGWIAQRG
jgi:predicted Mrr-cat superfamily restriction endonuclease